MKRITKIHISVILFNVIMITNCILYGLKKNELLRYFKEGETLTFFSAFFLGTVSFLSLLIYYAKKHVNNKLGLVNFWTLSAFAFFFLMLDEFFMIHEGMDRAILKVLGADPRALNFDGLIIGFFGLCALALLCRSRNEFKAHRDFTRCLVFGFIALVFMVIFDQMEQGRDLYKALDDSFKIVGVSYFLGGYVSVVLDCLKPSSLSDAA